MARTTDVCLRGCSDAVERDQDSRPTCHRAPHTPNPATPPPPCEPSSTQPCLQHLPLINPNAIGTRPRNRERVTSNGPIESAPPEAHVKSTCTLRRGAPDRVLTFLRSNPHLSTLSAARSAAKFALAVHLANALADGTDATRLAIHLCLVQPRLLLGKRLISFA